MAQISLEATPRTPLVDFNFDERQLLMKGESYPEDAAAFFGPLLNSLDFFLSGLGSGNVTFDLELSYFNSSSAKALMNMFQLLEAAAGKGAQIKINWRYDEDDDTMEEFGEDFLEDFEHASFELCPQPAS